MGVLERLQETMDAQRKDDSYPRISTGAMTEHERRQAAAKFRSLRGRGGVRLGWRACGPTLPAEAVRCRELDEERVTK